ncbi:hypothetical protein [Paenibacillus radicis (ex Gao et al. 2016)]|uniref:Helicase XPB/Ssl2 N-terminal domain-containing protein n=1 Tax=Paenibacillus radicis (ex Gao et al. 2016) TaxID=1737354 RepID=A0A917LUW1_9BACL|nr:hypothetical protein [Paenibacillus radicis (ex Gao et al. 2016)]GGG58379.1 hypothetical protein GCM10010918_09330 [Paenibacillus radicis (ex Gao et al. 2016)]
MNFSDMLGYADIGQLSRIASVYRCECNGHSKNDLIQSILSTLSRNDVFEAQINGMNVEELRFLNSLMFETRDSFSLEELIARVQQSKFGETEPPVTQAEQQEPPVKPKRSRKKSEPQPVKEVTPRDIIARFKHQGWLFNGFSGPNRYLFQVPHDLRTRFRDTLKRKYAAQLQYTDEPHMYRDEQQLMSGDIRQTLHYIHHNDVQLAADGSMYKRFSMQLLDSFAVREELPAKGEWRFGYGRHFHHYPNRMSLLFDYCRSMRYFEDNQQTLVLTTAGQERMAGAPGNETELLYKLWLRLYKLPIPNLIALSQWINGLAEQWVTLSSLRPVLMPLIKPYYYDDANKILEHRLIGMMVHLGLLRIGDHQEHGTVIRMTKAGRAVMAGISLENNDKMFLL